MPRVVSFLLLANDVRPAPPCCLPPGLSKYERLSDRNLLGLHLIKVCVKRSNATEGMGFSSTKHMRFHQSEPRDPSPPLKRLPPLPTELQFQAKRPDLFWKTVGEKVTFFRLNKKQRRAEVERMVSFFHSGKQWPLLMSESAFAAAKTTRRWLQWCVCIWTGGSHSVKLDWASESAALLHRLCCCWGLTEAQGISNEAERFTWMFLDVAV